MNVQSLFSILEKNWRLICVHADGLFKVQESLNKIVFVLH